jgi:hypothetical protein
MASRTAGHGQPSCLRERARLHAPPPSLFFLRRQRARTPRCRPVRGRGTRAQRSRNTWLHEAVRIAVWRYDGEVDVAHHVVAPVLAPQRALMRNAGNALSPIAFVATLSLSKHRQAEGREALHHAHCEVMG